MSFVFPSKCRPLSQNILWKFLGMGGWGKGDSRCKYRLLCCTSCNLPEKVFLFVCLIQQRTNPSLLIQDNHYHAVVDSQNHIFHLILEHTGKKKRKKIICKLQKFSVDKKKSLYKQQIYLVWLPTSSFQIACGDNKVNIILQLT